MRKKGGPDFKCLWWVIHKNNNGICAVKEIKCKISKSNKLA